MKNGVAFDPIGGFVTGESSCSIGEPPYRAEYPRTVEKCPRPAQGDPSASHGFVI
jgi:hypothetical protein